MNGQSPVILLTIEDANVVDVIKNQVEQYGFGMEVALELEDIDMMTK